MLDRKHTETMRKHSQYKTADDEEEAYDTWKACRDREPKRRKVEPPNHRKTCTKCAEWGW